MATVTRVEVVYELEADDGVDSKDCAVAARPREDPIWRAVAAEAGWERRAAFVVEGMQHPNAAGGIDGEKRRTTNDTAEADAAIEIVRREEHPVAAECEMAELR